MKKKRFIVFYGPTGVGKTDIALKIAERIPCQIINMDMGQCYVPLTIGTAKPDWRSLKTPHHLFDIINQPTNITVVQYRAACLEVMQQIWAQGDMPILVGGSGFYLRSLFFPPLQEEGIKMFESDLECGTLWDTLNAIDPDRASQIHPNDTYRLQRALYIWRSSGKKPSEYAPIYNPPGAYNVYCLTRERSELYERIDSRVLMMLQDGWIEETQKLMNTPWQDFLQSKKIIGYSDIFNFLAGNQTAQDKQAMISQIQQRTRNYAKRQMTFWRKLEKDLLLQQKSAVEKNEIEAANLTLLGVDLYISQLLKKVDTWFA